MNKLSNYATARGYYNSLETIIQSNENTILLINNLEIIKRANKTLWATRTLTYTINVKNLSSIILKNIRITDVLDPKLISLIVESIRINNIPAGYSIFTYNKNNGFLAINLPEIGPNEVVVIEYQVRKNMIEIFKLDNIAILSFDSDNPLIPNNNIISSNVVTVYGISEICKCKEK